MSIELKPVEKQVIVITGASSGIGMATALAAAGRGAKLVLNARSDQTLEEIVQFIREQGGEAVHVTADVAHRAEVDKIADAALDEFGRIDTWVNNAGLSIYGKLEQVSEEDSRRLFDINFWGVVNGAMVALPYLRRHGGALINVGSEVSEAVVPLQGMYSASKHAVKGFTDALRVELHADDVPVAVTLIQPTATDTPFPQHARNYMDQEPKLPSPQINPDQVAQAILHAAEHETRAAKVGMMAKVNTTTARMLPSLGEWMAKKQITRQQYDERPRNPEGTLYRPGEDGHTHGTGGHERSRST